MRLPRTARALSTHTLRIRILTGLVVVFSASFALVVLVFFLTRFAAEGSFLLDASGAIFAIAAAGFGIYQFIRELKTKEHIERDARCVESNGLSALQREALQRLIEDRRRDLQTERMLTVVVITLCVCLSEILGLF